MSWLIRGIIISIILLGIGALLLLPEMTFNKVVAPAFDAIMQKTGINNSAEQNAEAVKFYPILREPLINPASVVKTKVKTKVTTSTEESDAQTQNKQSEQAVSLQRPPKNLSDSDSQVIALVNNINPKLTEWITPTEQIRKWVAFIDRIAQGKISTKYRPLTFKIAAFKVMTKNGRLYADPENHKRFDTLIDVITAVRPDLLVSYYRYWQPILDKAYAELGNARSFSQSIRLAMDNVLVVKPLDDLSELKQPTSVIYKYIDTEIESSGDITKWVWRIGPENANKLQNYLSEFIRQLDS